MNKEFAEAIEIGGWEPTKMLWVGNRPPQEMPSEFCLPEARQFAAWCAELIAQLSDRRIGAEEIRVAKLLLQEKWWDVRCSVESTHRAHLTNDEGGRCVTGVYVACLEEIVAIGIRMAPPSLIRETKPTRTPRSRLPGVFIGRREHGDEGN